MTKRWLTALAMISLGALVDGAEDRGPVVAVDAPEWRELAERFAREPEVVADFEERRHFPFRKTPIVLQGEVRVSRRHGLSLSYTSPDRRIVILDERGVVWRDSAGDKPPPADPRAMAANQAMFHILRLDFAALEKTFEIFGTRGPDEWALTLVPRAESIRRALGDIFVAGDNVSVRRIELRRSAKQHVDIEIAPPRTAEAFGVEDVKRYFR